MAAAAEILMAVEVWLYCGLTTAVLFLAFGLDRLDDSAGGAFVFRALLVPGLVLLWPVVIFRWFTLATGRDDWAKRHRPPRRAHARVWSVLAALIPAIFLAAMLLNQPLLDAIPSELAPMKLADPPG